MQPSILLYLLLSIHSTFGSSIVSSIIKSFEQKYPTHCVVLTQTSASLEYSLVFTDIHIPIQVISINDLSSMKEASQKCKNHIFMVRDLQDLDKISLDSLFLGGKYGIFVQSSDTNSLITNLFQNRKSILSKILDLVVIGKKKIVLCFLCKSNLLSLAPLGDKYVIYGRDQATETKLEIFNIWGDGSYRWQNREIFPIRMSNLNGRKIKATSFDYKPFCYPVDGVYQGYEVIRSLKLYLVLLNIYRLFL